MGKIDINNSAPFVDVSISYRTEDINGTYVRASDGAKFTGSGSFSLSTRVGFTGGSFFVSQQAAVPEPTTMLGLALAGLGAGVACLKRRHSKAA